MCDGPLSEIYFWCNDRVMCDSFLHENILFLCDFLLRRNGTPFYFIFWNVLSEHRQKSEECLKLDNTNMHKTRLKDTKHTQHVLNTKQTNTF